MNNGRSCELQRGTGGRRLPVGPERCAELLGVGQSAGGCQGRVIQLVVDRMDGGDRAAERGVS